MLGNLKRRLALGVAVLMMAAGLSACGETVEVPTAHRGKISTSEGLKEGILNPSRIRLSTVCRICDNLILAEVSDYPVEESMKLFMPKDSLNIVFDVRGTFATSDAAEDLDVIFSRMSPMRVSDRISRITSEQVYKTYAQQIIRDVVRAVLAEYTIEELQANREAAGQALRDAVRDALEGRPVKVLNFGLGSIQWPEIVVKAEEQRKNREIQVKQAEAEKEIKLRQAEAALEVAKLQQAVELKEAETQVLVEQKLREGFSEAYVAQRGLKILSELAASNNKIVFLPTEALSNPAVMIGGLGTTLGDEGPAQEAR